MNITATIETRTATIIRLSNGIIETRFKDNAMIDELCIRENNEARRTLCNGLAHAWMTIVPANVQFATSAMTNDLFPSAQEMLTLVSTALVAPRGITGMMARLYFTTLPEVPAKKVFSDEDQAFHWLEKSVAIAKNCCMSMMAAA